jgi:hypothetical protein
MHIAAAISSRLVSIHTWTDPRRVGPYNADASVWKNGQLLRAGELAEAKLKKGRRFTVADVPSIVDLVTRMQSESEATKVTTTSGA